MDPGLLHVVTAIANPARWRSRFALYDLFEQHMLRSGVQLTTVECAYGDEDHRLAVRPGVNHVRVWAKSHVWLKENLINLGLSRLPRDWRYVAWIDADITFRRPDWVEAALHALQHFDLIQPWEHCYDLGPAGEHIALHCSFGRQWMKDPITTRKLGKGYTFAHPGYAWAATRHALEHLGGLIDHAVCGAGDHHMALGLVGNAAVSLPGTIHPNYARAVLAWQARATRHICGNIGYVPGTIEHGWHGPKQARRYIDRWSILTQHGFDPDLDIKRGPAGVIELTGNKPELKRDLWRYFQQRNEDANSL